MARAGGATGVASISMTSSTSISAEISAEVSISISSDGSSDDAGAGMGGGVMAAAGMGGGTPVDTRGSERSCTEFAGTPRIMDALIFCPGTGLFTATLMADLYGKKRGDAVPVEMPQAMSVAVSKPAARAK